MGKKYIHTYNINSKRSKRSKDYDGTDRFKIKSIVSIR